MAQNIKGITIEIGGNTTKLQDALKGVNKQIYNCNSELKQLDKALKLDPKNTELLAQKQDVLKNAIKATTDKLESLKTAQKQMGDYSKLTEEQKEQYRKLSVEITKAESDLKGFNQELSKTKTFDTTKLENGLKKVGEIALKVGAELAKIAIATGTALAGVVAAGVKSYADLEQNIGGVETLFKGNADKVIENAKKAYQTAGVSANEYMQGVVSFSASLLQSLGNDTAKAADVADMAFKDMSDNANKMGTDMSSIQNAYQGFAKQNYTMLDNLKLGYGGTKTEMERLLKDAEKFSGIHYDIKNLSDVYSAIHVIQEQMGITGTTAKEATETITGSFNSMKAAFDNFLNGSGSPEDLADTILNVLSNIGKAITKLAPSILSGIVVLIKEVVPEAIKMLFDLIPTLMDAISNMIDELLSLLTENTDSLQKAIVDLMNKGIEFMTNNLPKIVQIALTLVLTFARALAEAWPKMQPAIYECVLTIVEIIIDNLDLIVEVALDLIIALTEGIIDSLPVLIDKIPTIIEKLVEAIIRCLPKIFEAGGRILEKLVDGIGNIGNKMDELGKNLMQGLIDGIQSGWNKLKDGVGKTANNITNFFKEKLGIHSPSKVFRDEIGKNIGLGLIEGIKDTEKDVNYAMSQLGNGIEASVNPTINPTANSNPLIIQIENFNNTRASDIEQLAQELEFYRKNSALARGGLNE